MRPNLLEPRFLDRPGGINRRNKFFCRQEVKNCANTGNFLVDGVWSSSLLLPHPDIFYELARANSFDRGFLKVGFELVFENLLVSSDALGRKVSGPLFKIAINHVIEMEDLWSPAEAEDSAIHLL